MDRKIAVCSIEKNIEFVIGKMEAIAKEEQNRKMDIKQMADFHRYSETVVNLAETLSILEK